MIVGVAKEVFPGERRVALVPAILPSLTKAGLEVVIEGGSGVEAGYWDQAYQEKGARIAASRDEVLAADILLLVRMAGAAGEHAGWNGARPKPGSVVIGMADPLGNPEAALEAAQSGATLFALELLPRITRAQSMDVLSSMATIAGYRAVLLAATALPKMFPMMMTAAGTIRSAKVFVVGAGVAGLQAIASARRLGAIVSAYDVRPAVKEQVESLGASFLDLGVRGEETEGGYAKELTPEQQAEQQRALAERIPDFDVVVTTALVPGRPAWSPRDGPQDEPRLGRCRSGGRAGQQLRVDPAGRDGRRPRGDDPRADQSARRKSPTTPAKCTPGAIAVPHEHGRPGAVEARYGRRNHPRNARRPGTARSFIPASSGTRNAAAGWLGNGRPSAGSTVFPIPADCPEHRPVVLRLDSAVNRVARRDNQAAARAAPSAMRRVGGRPHQQSGGIGHVVGRGDDLCSKTPPGRGYGLSGGSQVGQGRRRTKNVLAGWSGRSTAKSTCVIRGKSGCYSDSRVGLPHISLRSGLCCGGSARGKPTRLSRSHEFLRNHASSFSTKVRRFSIGFFQNQPVPANADVHPKRIGRFEETGKTPGRAVCWRGKNLRHHPCGCFRFCFRIRRIDDE